MKKIVALGLVVYGSVTFGMDVNQGMDNEKVVIRSPRTLKNELEEKGLMTLDKQSKISTRFGGKEINRTALEYGINSLLTSYAYANNIEDTKKLREEVLSIVLAK
jgi:hypothetical protein